MVFEFVFSISEVKSRIEGFIAFLHTQAHEQGLKFSDKIQPSQNSTFYSFFIDSFPQEALDFANEISKKLPSSIYFNFIELKATEDTQIDKWHKTCGKSKSFLDVLSIREILDSTSAKFCDVFGYVSEIEFLSRPISDVSTLKIALKDLATRLKNGENVNIQTSRGLKQLSLVCKTQDVMFWDISNLFTYTRIEKIQSEVLASYEKPTMKLLPKEVFAPLLLKHGEDFEFKARLPFDLMLALLGIFALELEMGYVFIKDIPKKQAPHLSYKHPIIPKEQELVVSKDGVMIDTMISKKSRSILDIIHEHFEEDSSSQKDPQNEEQKEKAPRRFRAAIKENHQQLIIFLSKTNPTNILVKDGKSIKSLFPIEFDNNPKNLLEAIKNNYEGGEKLVSNFSQHFEDTYSLITSLPSTPNLTNNLLDIFASASFVLGYSQNFDTKNQKILPNAKKFLRDKGPRIDFKLEKSGDGVYLDYPKILRSSMSFRIAGLDEATLSYGFVDSMAEFLGNFVADVAVNFNIKKVLICGNILDEKIFLDKMLHYLPKNIDLMLPQEGYIDYKS